MYTALFAVEVCIKNKNQGGTYNGRNNQTSCPSYDKFRKNYIGNGILYRGKLCSEITNISDSSVIFKFGAVTYSNFYKVKMGVDEGKINNYGVYSTEVACEMAKK